MEGWISLTNLLEILKVFGSKYWDAWDSIERACRTEECVIPFGDSCTGRVGMKARKDGVVPLSGRCFRGSTSSTGEGA